MPKRIQKLEKIYTMVSSQERQNIINDIDNGTIEEKCHTGKKQHWWKNKHHPNKDIPKNIYLLGYGTIDELHKKYNKSTYYPPLPYTSFINWTRELINQNIMK